MIAVTEVAKKKFRQGIEAEGRQGHGLRVIVNNAGTQQPEFALNFVAPGEVREEKINPAIAAHSGQVSLVAVEDATAYFR